MADRIKIPKDIRLATETLVGIDGLMSAREWERAAVVWAFTQGEHRGKNLNNEVLTIKAFAALKIAGLRTENTVAKYRKTWQSAIDRRTAVEVRPGQTIELPTEPWPGPGDEGYHGDPTRYVKKDPSAIARVLNDEMNELEVETFAQDLNTFTADTIVDTVVERGSLAGATQDGSSRTLDERWANWIHRMNGLMMEGHGLAKETDDADIAKLGLHTELALGIYRQLAERQLDAELRHFYETEGA